ncbi:outer membrane beta-barrel protein [Xanthobacter sp. DSM 24535]|uniref:outer membrane protein n=1 Tax=Roseixanthobacter psychrophilus TaxID=3119917 RepID=UPI00372A8451
MMPLLLPRLATQIAIALLASPLLAAASLAADLPPGFLGKAGDFTLNAPEVEEDSPSGWYFRADAGYAATNIAAQTGALSFPVSSQDGTWTIGGGLGYRFTPWLRTDVAMDYLAPFNAAATGGDARVTVTTALASAYWDIATWNGLTPYVGGGLGFGIVALERDPFLSVGGISTQSWQFAWELAAGVSWALAPSLNLDFGYRYIAIDMPSTSASAGIIALQDLNTHQFRIGVRYALN